jgi:hypothetical protein
MISVWKLIGLCFYLKRVTSLFSSKRITIGIDLHYTLSKHHCFWSLQDLEDLDEDYQKLQVENREQKLLIKYQCILTIKILFALTIRLTNYQYMQLWSLFFFQSCFFCVMSDSSTELWYSPYQSMVFHLQFLIVLI